MTLSKSSLSMDKRHSISRTFSWLPSPIISSVKEDHRQRTSVPFLNTHMNFTTPTLSLSPSPTTTPTAKKLGFFSKFKSSLTDLDQILTSSDEEEEEEGHHLPPTPRDSQRLSSPSIALTSSSSSVTLPAMLSLSSSPKVSSRTRALTTGPILTTTTIITTEKPQATLASPSPLTSHSPSPSPSPSPPPPPQHASLNQYIQSVLASTFDDVDKNIIDVEWDRSRRQLEIDLLTPAPFQYS